MTIKIIVADDHKIMRDGLCALIKNQPDMEVIAEAATGREALELAQKTRPDIVIMDIGMPDLNGMEATRMLVAALPDIKVIGLSMYSDKRYVAGMLKAGALGYLVKACAFEDLADSISAVSNNQTYLSPCITSVVVEDYVSRLHSTGSKSSSELTGREREILQLIAEGWSTGKIASHLHVSVKTVHTHRQRIMDKLNLHSVAELTKYAILEGLTAPEP